jgi:2-polyprenyl-3-methyl-5-hydroxy-6-metoxy-1,4-benzoquinol methylase
MQQTELASIYRHRWNERELAELNGVWKVLVREFFQAFVPRDGNVLDVGCGFCGFLNAVEAERRIGVDANPQAARFAQAGVEVRTIENLGLEEWPAGFFDCIFISNFLEHLEGAAQVLALLRRVRELLSPRGRVVILQPNFRLLGRRYFDFIDHKTILTDAGMREALDLVDLALEREVVRFLPYTSKSRLSQRPALVSLYLRLPIFWYFFGKQSLFVAKRAL